MAKDDKAPTTKQGTPTNPSGIVGGMVSDVNSGAVSTPVIEIDVPVAGATADDLQPFPEDLIDHEAEAARTTVKLSEQEQYERDMKKIWVRPRRNLVRTKLGSDWHTFEKGKEYLIEQWKADWLMEKGYL
jgi:hypothetical protein